MRGGLPISMTVPANLHRRHDIGVHSYGSYHSIDPGKLTMAPHFAAICANRILSKSAP